MIPRYGDPRRRTIVYRVRAGAYVVAWHRDRLLLTRQSEPRACLQLPGGGVAPGEGPLQAAHREVFEETGWRITGLRKLGVFRRFTEMSGEGYWAEKVCHIYRARAVRPLSAPSDPAHSALLLPLEAALERLDEPGEAEILAHALAHGDAARRSDQPGPR